MSAPQTLIQAALQRLGARLGSGLVDAAAGLAVLAQDAPDKLRQEWELFCQEVEQEAERLERQQGGGDTPAAQWTEPAATPAGAGAPAAGGPPPVDPNGNPQDQIDALRARIASLSRRLEQRP